MVKTRDKIMVIFLLLQPILDSLVVLTPSFPINTIIRGAFFLYIFLYLIKDKSKRRISFLLLFTMSLYFLYHIFYLNSSILNSCTSILKFYYLIFILLYFSQRNKKDIFKYLIIVLIEYMSIYLLSYLFHFGHNIYSESIGKTGYRGLFQSINEYSAILIILYYSLFDDLKRKKICFILISVFLFLISYLAGTKVLLGGLILIFVVKLFPIVIRRWKNMSSPLKISSIILSCLIFISLIYIFTFTNTYKNMVVQAKFFHINNIFSFEGINKVLFNDRLTFLIQNHQNFIHQNFMVKLFGIGYFHPLKLVEIDLFDILYRYGLLGFSIEIISFFLAFKRIKQQQLDRIGFLLLLAISFTSGHVLLSPSVSIYFGVLLLQEEKQIQKEKRKEDE